MEYLSVFRPNAGKYGTAKTPYLDIFYAVCLFEYFKTFRKYSKVIRQNIAYLFLILGLGMRNQKKPHYWAADK